MSVQFPGSNLPPILGSGVQPKGNPFQLAAQSRPSTPPQPKPAADPQVTPGNILPLLLQGGLENLRNRPKAEQKPPAEASNMPRNPFDSFMNRSRASGPQK